MQRLLLFILLAIVTGALLFGCGGKREINPSGTLEATEVDIASTIAGRILEVRFELGDAVSALDTLIVLDTELLQLQRAQTAANRESIQAQQRVAEDALKQARENSQLAETTFNRVQSLLDQGSVTQQQADEARTKRDVAATQVSAARHQIDALAAEEEKLNAALNVFNRQIRDGVIVAPQNGTVILRKAEPGEVATPGAVQLRVADLSSLELRVYLGERDLDRVQIGKDVTVLVDAMRDQPLKGQVIWVSSEAEFTPKNAQTRDARAQLVYAVKVRVANSEGKLHIGMPAEIQL
ncbi:MAG: HlyD family secretion protein [Calditrichota bacterium]